MSTHLTTPVPAIPDRPSEGTEARSVSGTAVSIRGAGASPNARRATTRTRSPTASAQPPRIITGAALIIIAVSAASPRRPGDVSADGIRRRHRPAARRHARPPRARPAATRLLGARNWYLPHGCAGSPTPTSEAPTTTERWRTPRHRHEPTSPNPEGHETTIMRALRLLLRKGRRAPASAVTSGKRTQNPGNLGRRASRQEPRESPADQSNSSVKEARLKIVVSPVRVRVSPSLNCAQLRD
jgi:hypothetical protein